MEIKRLLQKIKLNIELRKYLKRLKDNCEVTGVYKDYRSGLTIKKIN